MAGAATVHIDGASRGNPGDAAYAVVIQMPNGTIVEDSGVLGKETNNIAEYTALLRALEKAKELALTSLTIHSDSELLVKQMNGEYKVKNADLKWLYDEAQRLMKDFARVQVVHVRRENNRRADELCNLVLDGQRPTKPSKKTASVTGEVKAISDGAVRADCLECLAGAKACWGRGEAMPSVELVWDQLWSILEERGVLRKAK
jgi:ribonuclease HI